MSAKSTIIGSNRFIETEEVQIGPESGVVEESIGYDETTTPDEGEMWQIVGLRINYGNPENDASTSGTWEARVGHSVSTSTSPYLSWEDVGFDERVRFDPQVTRNDSLSHPDDPVDALEYLHGFVFTNDQPVQVRIVNNTDADFDIDNFFETAFRARINKYGL